MSVKLIAIYQQPEDEQTFASHYNEVHTPIVRSIPGLQELIVNRRSKHLMGDHDPYMIVEMAFADQASFSAAMKSEENQKAGQDLKNFADGIVSLIIAETD